MATCEYCGQPTNPDSRGRPCRYCSADCRNAARSQRLTGNHNHPRRRRTFAAGEDHGPDASLLAYHRIRPTVDQLREVAVAYWGLRGAFVYSAYLWANETCFAGRIAVPLFQWVPTTPYGRSLAYVCDTHPSRPVITMAQRLAMRSGEITDKQQRVTADVVLHELVHVSVALIGRDLGSAEWRTSHNNELWRGEIDRISGVLGIRRCEDHPESWPYSCRPRGYYEHGQLPFRWDPDQYKTDPRQLLAISTGENGLAGPSLASADAGR